MNSTCSDRLHHDFSNTTTTQQEHKGAQEKVCFIIYNLNFKNDFLIKHFEEISQKDIGKRILKINLKEALTDSPLLIINCGNFLNDDRFNFLTDRINFNPLTDFPINERLYGEALFHIFLQNERYSITYSTIRIIIDLVNILKSSHSNTNRLYHNTTTTQQEHKGARGKVCFIIYTLNFKNDFLIKHFKEFHKKTLAKGF